MLSEFDELVRKRAELKTWWSLGASVAAYSNKLHSLRIDVKQPSLVAFCGQQYAGAKNYHDAPEFFVEAIRKEMEKESHRIAKQAYENETARLDAAIERHRLMVLEQLAKS